MYACRNASPAGGRSKRFRFHRGDRLWYVGGGIAGPVGMLLAVPITSSAYILFKEATAKREQKQIDTFEKEEEKTEETTD